MTKIKLCGLSRPGDIEAANELRPEYVGFVFAQKSRRYITQEEAEKLKKLLHPEIKAVGVFVNEKAENVAWLLNSGVIDIAQLHGSEDAEYIRQLRSLSDKPLIRACRIRTPEDLAEAEQNPADAVLLDSGAGTGKTFDWSLIRNIGRPYFLAGGLDPENVEAAIKMLKPYAVDVSSGIESDGMKDQKKMRDFVSAVRKGGNP